MVIVVENGLASILASIISDGPTERVRQFAIEGCKFVARWVAAGFEVTRVGRIVAFGAGARADVAAVVVVHAEDESVRKG